MMNNRIHALPGMGADRRMFPEPWSQLPGFTAHDWPDYHEESTLNEMARSFCESSGIRDGDSLVGASLGGMVACEIAKLKKIRSLYLVGSAIHKAEINQLLAALHPLVSIAPLQWIKFSSGKIPADLAQMFAETNPRFVRAMCAAIFHWEGLQPSQTTCFRIHGLRDRVIPLPESVDLTLDGGHLIAMSHAKECVEFIREREQAADTNLAGNVL
jgi:pimeloyl-ACP methyl ester carboxylesterase